MNIKSDDAEFIITSMLRRTAINREKKPFGISSIQRDYLMGYNRAARIRDYGLQLGVLKVSDSHPYLVEFIFEGK